MKIKYEEERKKLWKKVLEKKFGKEYSRVRNNIKISIHQIDKNEISK